MQSNFIEITIRDGCSPVNLLHIFRALFLENTSGWLLLQYEQSRKKLTGESKEIKQGLKNFDICFSVIFSCYDQRVISGKETGHLTLPPTDLEIFLIFPSFLSITSFGNSLRQRIYKVYHTRNQVPFFL